MANLGKTTESRIAARRRAIFSAVSARLAAEVPTDDPVLGAASAVETEPSEGRHVAFMELVGTLPSPDRQRVSRIMADAVEQLDTA